MSWLSCRTLHQAQFASLPCPSPGSERHSRTKQRCCVCPNKHGRAVCAHAETSGGFGEGLKRFGKRVQGAMPIVGLFSRLAAPDGGGFEDQVRRLTNTSQKAAAVLPSGTLSGSRGRAASTGAKGMAASMAEYCMQSYPEYCRTQLEEGSIKLNCSCADMRVAKGPVGSRKIVLFLAWMIRQGCGLLPDQYFIMSARRLNASMDLEAEMYRFESNIDAEKQKYSMMDLPTSDHEKQATVAVDAVSTCCLGLRDDGEVAQEDSPLLLDLISALFPEVAEDFVEGAIQKKTERKYA